MDWILALALGTFALLVAFLLWTRISTHRHSKTGNQTSGLGGMNDPLSGAGADVRPADEMLASMDKAAETEKPSLH